jgi:hypothetical protein
MKRALVLLVAGVLLFGCSSDSKDSSTTPVQQCQDFANSWCGHAIGCYVEVGRLAATDESSNLDACKRVAIAAVPCDKAVAVGSTYDSCLSEVNAMPCSTWDVEPTALSTITPPTSCAGVIKVTQ